MIRKETADSQCCVQRSQGHLAAQAAAFAAAAYHCASQRFTPRQPLLSFAVTGVLKNTVSARGTQTKACWCADAIGNEKSMPLFSPATRLQASTEFTEQMQRSLHTRPAQAGGSRLRSRAPLQLELRGCSHPLFADRPGRE